MTAFIRMTFVLFVGLSATTVIAQPTWRDHSMVSVGSSPGEVQNPSLLSPGEVQNPSSRFYQPWQKLKTKWQAAVRSSQSSLFPPRNPQSNSGTYPIWGDEEEMENEMQPVGSTNVRRSPSLTQQLNQLRINNQNPPLY